MWILAVLTILSVAPLNITYKWLLAGRKEKIPSAEHLSDLNQPGSCCKWRQCDDGGCSYFYFQTAEWPTCLATVRGWWEERTPCMVSSPGRLLWSETSTPPASSVVAPSSPPPTSSQPPTAPRTSARSTSG